MTRSERAAQIWPLLTICASHRQILSYDLLSKLIGVPRPGLGQLLEPIQSYCIIKGLPALTCLVVGENSGLPGEGFVAASDVPSEQAAVFAFDWLSHPVPAVDQLETAVQQLPSNGRALKDLLKQIAN
ncbi:MAG: hypothetical protein ACFFCW_32100 [Candidatus Hodarchaeota archaeon]